ncbi:MAG: DUF2341 domain-containing protein [Bacteroidales bacterium]|nr:DUF2341 domain-containing protein [Bacteroidales bacterium]
MMLFILLSLPGMVRLHGQWLEGYNYRAKITIDETMIPGNDTLTDFPMLFSYTDTLLKSKANGGYVSFQDGRDICFTGQDSLSILDYEFEYYNPATGTIVAWIRIPSVSAIASTELFFYYGNPDGTTEWDTAGVWSNQYTAVWHLNNDPSVTAPQIIDATSFINHGTTGGNMTENDLMEGKISGGIDFDGLDDYVTMPVNGFNPDSGTVEMWINLDSIPLTDSDYFFAHRQKNPISDRAYLRVWDTGEWGTGMGDTYDLARGSILDTASWHHLAITWDGTEVKGFLDGTLDIGPVSYAGLDTVREIFIMTWMPSSESANGTIDELRVSSVTRDPGWIMASYHNQNEPGSFYLVDPAVVYNDPCPASFNVTGGGSYCQGDSGVSITLSGSDPVIHYTLQLNDTILLDTIQGNGDPLTWSPVQQEGIYRIIAKDPGSGCIVLMNDSVEVEILPVPQLYFNTVSITCFEDDDGSISTTVTSGTEPYQFEWSGPDEYTSVQKDLTDLPPGIYELTVTDSNHCSTESTGVNVTEPELLVASLDRVTHLTAYEANDGAIEIEITGGTTPYTVSWTGTDDYVSDNQEATEMTVGYYAVLVTDDHLCMDSLTMIMVSVDEHMAEVFIPEGFSPNGDGYNDRFVILGLENYPDNELMVFNRQGVEVLHRVNYENDWGGRPEQGAVLGGVLPEGTYYYIFKFGETGLRKGYFYLNRE